MSQPVWQRRAIWMEWLSALARVLAFAGLFILLAIAFNALYRELAPARDAVTEMLGAAVPAAAALIAGTLLLRFADGRAAAALGIGGSRLTAPLCGIGLLIGMIGLTAAVLVLLVGGMLDYQPQAGTAAQWLSTIAAQAGLFAVAALAEEAIFRGYPFQVLVRATGAPFAIVLTSLGFAFAHGANPEVGTFALINIFLAGVLLAVAFLRTLSLWFVTALHLGWNWAMASLFDLPVSGLEIFDTPLYQPTVGGPDWLSGGAFGPEGGAVGTLGFAVALLAVLRLRLVRRDPGVVQAKPLVLRDEEQVLT